MYVISESELQAVIPISIIFTVTNSSKIEEVVLKHWAICTSLFTPRVKKTTLTPLYCPLRLLKIYVNVRTNNKQEQSTVNLVVAVASAISQLLNCRKNMYASQFLVPYGSLVESKESYNNNSMSGF